MNYLFILQARSKLPKKRRRVLPVEQPRRKREPPAPHRGRTNAIKQTPPTIGGVGVGSHTAVQAPAPMFKDAFGGAKIGESKAFISTCPLSSVCALPFGPQFILLPIISPTHTHTHMHTNSLTYSHSASRWKLIIICCCCFYRCCFLCAAV